MSVLWCLCGQMFLFQSELHINEGPIEDSKMTLIKVQIHINKETVSKAGNLG